MREHHQDWIDFINDKNDLYEWSDEISEYVRKEE